MTRPLLKLKEETLNDIHPMVREDQRKEFMTKALAISPKMAITNKQNPYY